MQLLLKVLKLEANSQLYSLRLKGKASSFLKGDEVRTENIGGRLLSKWVKKS